MEDRRAKAQAERNELWAKSQALRKKYVTLGLVRSKTQDGLSALLAKSLAVKNFEGKMGEQHRLFVFSGDLSGESASTPWANLSGPPAGMDELIGFIKTSSAADYDFCLAFDGRSRETRAAIEAHLTTHRGATIGEFVVLYAGNVARCASRRTFLGRQGTETGFLKMPLSRTRLTTKDRSDAFLNGKGLTTHDFNYIGVPFPSLNSLDKIKPAEKAAIFQPAGAQAPKKWDRSGVPLFWQESKGLPFWDAILGNLDVGAVFDVSPGSGVLARVCLQRGIQYVGVCFSETHLSWLCNCIDRHGLALIGQKGSSMYHEELSGHVSRLFQDVLEELNAADLADEESDVEEEEFA